MRSLGHSMGGAEIVRYLSRHGAGRVARIILVAPATPFLLKTADNPDGIEKSAFEQLRAAICRDYPKWLADNAPPFVVAETSPHMIQWVKGLMLQTPIYVMIECNRTLTETDLGAELRKIIVPALIIHGDNDRSTPIDLTGRRTAQLIPGSQLKVYEGAPHGLFITHMDRLNRDLLEFIRG